MRINTLITLGASATFGLMAVLLARGWIEDALEDEFASNRAVTSVASAAPQNMRSMLVVDTPLEFGDVLSRANLRLVDMPYDLLPEGSYSSFEELFSGSAQNNVALARMAYNEAVLDFKISGPGGRGSLSALIAEGKRATAIRVTDVAGVAGFVLPGDSVDIIYTRDESSRRGGDGTLLSDVMLQNVKVLGIDQDLSDQSTAPNVVSTVTVEVSNEEAQKLHVAMDAGRLSLTLRRVGETDVAPERRVTSKGLVGTHAKPKIVSWTPPAAVKTPPPPPPPAVDLTARITVIRGNDRDEVSVAMEDGISTHIDPLSSDELAGG